MAHYYTPDGQLVDGLREARKVGALVSPTTVLSMLKGEGLLRYLQHQAWEAGVTTPRNPGESDDAYYDRCMHWANEHSQTAKDKGLALHKMIQAFHQNAAGMRVEGMGHQQQAALLMVPGLAEGFDLYLRWYEKWVRKTLAVEQFVVGDGYAGTEDHWCILNDGRSALVDVKSQDISKRKKFNFYSNFAIQLGSYAGACPPEMPERKVDCIISIAVSSTGPAQLEAKVWPGEVSYYHGLFMGLLAVWREENQYWPTTEEVHAHP
jgi:hypothetical protein